MKGEVDVVIVAYNSADHLATCVAAAREWSAVARIIVVDNASTDASAEIAASVADEVVRSPCNRGFGAGQNLGAALVTTDVFLALNPDARIHPEGLARGLAVLQSTTQAAATQGIVRRVADGGVERTFGREPGVADLLAHRLRLRERVGERALKAVAPFVGLGYFSHREPAAPIVETKFLAAVAPLIRTDAFRSVAGFDEDYFLYAEDVDLSVRLRGAGWLLLSVHEEWATHVGAASTAGHRDIKEAEWWRGHRRLVSKHWTGARRMAGLTLTMGRSR